jgi:perosamine synthetase
MAIEIAATTSVPFFRPSITAAEIEEVVDVMTSGWLTTGPRVKRFEEEFARAVGAQHAVALNSCTAALHLAVEAMGLRPEHGVLVPTMTFAATAEVVRYLGATPILVDCDPDTCNMDLQDAERRLKDAGERGVDVVGLMTVHVGGLMMDLAAVDRFAASHRLWVVEDAAHAFPAAWRDGPEGTWKRCGGNTAAVSCFSFYANKTITTGEGGMAVTAMPHIAERMRLMSLHGLSRDAWNRYSGGGWDYRILGAGYKYNLTDVAAAIGIHQLARAEEMRAQREAIAGRYRDGFADLDEIELPPVGDNRVHAWHLFPIRLRLSRLRSDRNALFERLKASGVMCSVHWRPLHLHPYYAETYALSPAQYPVATELFPRLISLPLFPSMTPGEITHVIEVVRRVIQADRQ